MPSGHEADRAQVRAYSLQAHPPLGMVSSEVILLPQVPKCMDMLLLAMLLARAYGGRFLVLASACGVKHCLLLERHFALCR